jgi:hypothetical protein
MIRPLLAAGLMLASLQPVAALDAGCVFEIEQAMTIALVGSPVVIETHVDSPYGPTDTIAEMVPHRGIHSRSTSGGLNSEVIFIDGRGWTRSGDVWEEMPREVVEAMRGVYDTPTVDLEGLTDATCRGAATLEGRPAIEFGYKIVVEGTTTGVRYFIDAVTRRPIVMVTETPTPDGLIVVTSRYRDDPSLRIEPPPGSDAALPQPERIADDADRAQGHGRSGDHRGQ